MRRKMNETQKIYDRFGAKYHAKRLNPSTSFWNRCIEIPAMTSILKKIVIGKKVLDMGCGSGLMTKKISKWKVNVTGLDISKTMIEIARKENPGINFIHADARSTPFEPSGFDIISSSLMIHYFKDLDGVFKEVSRILLSGGSFVFSFHHPFNEIIECKNIKDAYKFNLKNYFEPFKYEWDMMKEMKMKSYHHTFENIVQNLAKNGLFIKKIIEPKPSPKTKSIDEISYNFTSRLPSFCIIHAVKLRK
jgi:ubiquinone/menaquinone biosynthesis C-methylase UbiE